MRGVGSFRGATLQPANLGGVSAPIVTSHGDFRWWSDVWNSRIVFPPVFAKLIGIPDKHFMPLFGGFQLFSELETPQKATSGKENKATEGEFYICGRKILQLFFFFLPAADLDPD